MVIAKQAAARGKFAKAVKSRSGKVGQMAAARKRMPKKAAKAKSK